MGKRTDLTLARKIQMLEALDQGKSQREVADAFNVTQACVSKVKGNRAEIQKNVIDNHNLSRKRKRDGRLPDVDERVFAWFCHQRNAKAEISGSLLIAQAKEIAREAGLQMEFSEGWLRGFRDRYNIKLVKLHGEKQDADTAGGEEWVKNVLPGLLDRYKKCDIFNCDETGLYYRATPDSTLALASEKVSGSKKRKERFTILLGANMTGSEKLKLFVVGKSQSPRCFKNIVHLPVSYRANNSSWMTATLFKEWLSDLDAKMRTQHRKIVMIMDRCPAHPADVRLTNIEVVFLPANTTGILQPMDAGVIHSFKHHYRRMLMERIVRRLDDGLEQISSEASKNITVLDAIHIMKQAWANGVTSKTVENCFRSCFGSADPRTGPPVNKEADDDGVDPAFVAFDDNLECTGEEEHGEPEEDEDDPLPGSEMTHTEALKKLDELKGFFEKQGLHTTGVWHLQDIVHGDASIKKKKQGKITDFFVRK